MTHARLAFTITAATLALAGAARADLEFCNDTAEIQSVSIAYQAPGGWVSEGWWNIEPGACMLPLAGPLANRYYLYRAEVEGGPFTGDGHFFCTSPEVYTIEGAEECAARGYASEDFAVIDTGPDATSHTFRITGDGSFAPPPPPDDEGLTVCNGTDITQSVSVGYFNGQWVSEGWWNIEPDACLPVLTGPLSEQYYYYRAEIEGGTFDGDGYFFCTSPDAYTIVGDESCRARGHDEEDFAEIDIGDHTSFVLTLIDDAGGGTVEQEESPRPSPDRGSAGTGKQPTQFPTFERKANPRPPRGN